MKEMKDLTLKRIGHAKSALANCEDPWAYQYWSNVLSYMLRLAKRCE